MNTTNLFVELIVIGVGAASWFGLFLLSIFGYRWIPTDHLSVTLAVVPVLSVVYLCGVITDRLADGIFTPLDRVMCRRFFCNLEFLQDEPSGWQKYLCESTSSEKQRANFYDDRDLILNASERFATLYEYGRSRQRIARGWAVNCIVLIVALNVFAASNLKAHPQLSQIRLGGTALIVLLAVLSILSWVILTAQQYSKIHYQANFLRKTRFDKQRRSRLINERISTAVRTNAR